MADWALKGTKDGLRLRVERPVCCGFRAEGRGLGWMMRDGGGGTCGDGPGGEGRDDAARRDSSAMLERSSVRSAPGTLAPVGCAACVRSDSVGSLLLPPPPVADVLLPRQLVRGTEHLHELGDPFVQACR